MIQLCFIPQTRCSVSFTASLEQIVFDLIFFPNFFCLTKLLRNGILQHTVGVLKNKKFFHETCNNFMGQYFAFVLVGRLEENAISQVDDQATLESIKKNLTPERPIAVQVKNACKTYGRGPPILENLNMTVRKHYLKSFHSFQTFKSISSIMHRYLEEQCRCCKINCI